MSNFYLIDDPLIFYVNDNLNIGYKDMVDLFYTLFVLKANSLMWRSKIPGYLNI